jgi:hypothetical protein
LGDQTGAAVSGTVLTINSPVSGFRHPARGSDTVPTGTLPGAARMGSASTELPPCRHGQEADRASQLLRLDGTSLGTLDSQSIAGGDLDYRPSGPLPLSRHRRSGSAAGAFRIRYIWPKGYDTGIRSRDLGGTRV